MGYKILAINPGSTSTKVALYDEEDRTGNNRWKETHNTFYANQFYNQRKNQIQCTCYYDTTTCIR